MYGHRMNSPEASPTPAATTPGPINGHRRAGGSGKSRVWNGGSEVADMSTLLVVDTLLVVLSTPKPTSRLRQSTLSCSSLQLAQQRRRHSGVGAQMRPITTRH